MPTKKISIKTGQKTDFIDITEQVRIVVKESGVENGLCVIFAPHTTAAVTINENTDPAVTKDISMVLDKLITWDDKDYKHFEGNSAAHIKSSIIGCSKTLIIKNKLLLLGRWQNIYLCDFDGPRTRTVHICTHKGI